MSNIDEVFNASFERTVGGSSFNKVFTEHFYSNLIGHSDEVANLFKNTNMSAQKTMLHDSLYLMVDYYRSNKLPVGMQRIAEVHNNKNKAIPDRMYDIWLDSLVVTLKEVDPEFSDDVEQAWRAVLAPGIAYMQSQF